MRTTVPVMKDLVLLGGGHAHVGVLKSFGMRPIDGVRVTLVNRDTDTPYSGMLPGLIAGHYSFDDTHIDLGRLARFSRARFIHAEATGVDLEKKQLLFANRPPLAFDVLSIDTGSTPNTAGVPGAAEHAVPLKPISNLLTRWDSLCERALAADRPLHVAIAGAGAAESGSCAARVPCPCRSPGRDR
jgi:selenide,water dikinase